MVRVRPYKFGASVHTAHVRCVRTLKRPQLRLNSYEGPREMCTRPLTLLPRVGDLLQGYSIHSVPVVSLDKFQ